MIQRAMILAGLDDVLVCDLRVPLHHIQAGMSKNCLELKERHAGADRIDRHRVAETVRMDVLNAGALAESQQQEPDCISGEWFQFNRQEERPCLTILPAVTQHVSARGSSSSRPQA